MIELNNFYNEGFGWVCRACDRMLDAPGSENASHSRLLREGEAESKTPRFSNAALARWTDESRTALICPRCGVEEKV